MAECTLAPFLGLKLASFGYFIGEAPLGCRVVPSPPKAPAAPLARRRAVIVVLPVLNSGRTVPTIAVFSRSSLLC